MPHQVNSAIPWKGLACAVALSLLAHGLMLFAMDPLWSFNFKGTATQVSLNTRVIQPVAAPSQPAVESRPPAPAPVAQPPIATAQQPSRPETAPATATAKPLPSENIEQNKPLPPVQSIEFATNTVANITSTTSTTETTAQEAFPSTPPVAVAGATDGSQHSLAYPSSVKLRFDAVQMRRGDRRSGSAEFSWRTDGVQYEIGLESTFLGLSILQQISAGKLSPQGLAPDRYSDKRLNRSEQASHFRREQGKIQFSNNKPEADLLAGAQDRLSAFIQLSGILGGGFERYLNGQTIQMQVASTDSAELWEFIPEGMQEVPLVGRNVAAIKLVRKPRDEFDQRFEIWLAPELNFLPVRIRQSSATVPNEDFTDLVLRKLP